MAVFNGNSQIKTGSIEPWATNIPPDGYLLCDGSAVSRTTYSELFKIIGTLFGAGDGSTTFNLPNGKFPLGTEVPVLGNGRGLLVTFGDDSNQKSLTKQYSGSDHYSFTGSTVSNVWPPLIGQSVVDVSKSNQGSGKVWGLSTNTSCAKADLTQATAVCNAIIKY